MTPQTRAQAALEALAALSGPVMASGVEVTFTGFRAREGSDRAIEFWVSLRVGGEPYEIDPHFVVSNPPMRLALDDGYRDDPVGVLAQLVAEQVIR